MVPFAHDAVQFSAKYGFFPHFSSNTFTAVEPSMSCMHSNVAHLVLGPPQEPFKGSHFDQGEGLQ